MLKLENVSKIYRTYEVETHALDNISMEIDGGEFVAIMGPSGCGKSTLLNILGLLDNVSSGTYRFFGEDVTRYGENRMTELRRSTIGFVFQSFNLIDDLTVAENVEVALLYRKVPGRERKQRVREALERVGVAHRARHMPQQLSGGQQQRVAIARALANRPSIVLADEPTGNLDPDLSLEIMNLFREINARGTTVVVATHDRELIRRVGRRAVTLDHGRMVEVT